MACISEINVPLSHETVTEPHNHVKLAKYLVAFILGKRVAELKPRKFKIMLQ